MKKNLKVWALLAAVLGLAAFASLQNDQASAVPKKVYTTHVVKEGDTLWDISKYYVGEGVDCRKVVHKIMMDNGLKTGHLEPGQRLLIFWTPGTDI